MGRPQGATGYASSDGERQGRVGHLGLTGSTGSTGVVNTAGLKCEKARQGAVCSAGGGVVITTVGVLVRVVGRDAPEQVGVGKRSV